jgi:hypothetical protein
MKAEFQLTTASGSTYDITGNATHIRRTPDPAALDDSELRSDNTWLRLHAINGEPARLPALLSLVVGQPAVLHIEPLDPAADITVRTTTPITGIRELDTPQP